MPFLRRPPQRPPCCGSRGGPHYLPSALRAAASLLMPTMCARLISSHVSHLTPNFSAQGALFPLRGHPYPPGGAPRMWCRPVIRWKLGKHEASWRYLLMYQLVVRKQRGEHPPMFHRPSPFHGPEWNTIPPLAHLICNPGRGRNKFPYIKEGRRGDAMTPSLPCANCGQVDNLETVHPLGTHADKAVIWNCRCGNTRAIKISHHLPHELIRKAILANKSGEKPFRRGGRSE